MTQQIQSLLVFAREPKPGRVKTRLIPALGQEKATGIYKKLLVHALKAAVSIPDCRVELWCDLPEQEAETCTRYARESGIKFQSQEGPDLGARMATAMAAAFEHSDRVVLIGSDSPEYDAEYLAQAFDALRSHELVLGPALDGGYVLIGMSRPVTELFVDIPWGTGQVLEMTRERIKQVGASYYEMPVLSDVDTAADVSLFEDYFNEVINDSMDRS